MAIGKAEGKHRRFLTLALEQARKSYGEGGIPIGATLVRDDNVLAVGHNKRVQENDPIAHGEMDCIRAAGRQKDYSGATLYTTLSPCMMCSGTIIHYRIFDVFIGENETLAGNIDFLRQHGVNVLVLDDQECKALMQ